MVWLYCPAVSPGKAKKFHSAWKGPYKVLKAISDVVYRIQHVTPSTDRRRRQRLVVHFNRLKPCYSSTSGNPSENPPPATSSRPDSPTDTSVDEDLMVPIPSDESTANPDTNTAPEADVSQDQDTDQEVDTRGGPQWEGRLRRAVHPPDFYRPS